MSAPVRTWLLQALLTGLMVIGVAFGVGLTAIGIWEMNTHMAECERTPTP